MIEDVAYRTRHHGGRIAWVSGAQVGRFAIRMRQANEIISSEKRVCRPFVVDHINSGFCAADFDSFDEALRFADDLSRFCKRDPSSRAMDRLCVQIGTDVLQWMRLCCRANQHLPYREWLAVRRQAA